MICQIPFAPSCSALRTIIMNNGWLGDESSPNHPHNDATRTTIAGGKMLTVPVAGGRGRLKHRQTDLEKIQISDHGRWRQEHLGAINAAYGKAPYFQYIFPEIEKIYENNSHGSLGEFNHHIFCFIKRFLDLDTLLPSIKEMNEKNPDRLQQLKSEYETKVNLNYSIFDAIFRLGKNAVFLLI